MRSLLCTLLLAATLQAHAQWQFAVAGDSRNCGGVVMPAIAKSVKATPAQFYWHLGDFRKISDFDEDMLAAAEVKKTSLTIRSYYANAWPDFIVNQVNHFSPLTVYLGIGNHETYPPKSKTDWIIQFGDWLTQPNLVRQRRADDPNDRALKPYYHWIQNGVDFINTDNGGQDFAYDDGQLKWLTARFKYIKEHPEITTVVLGGHGALPHSLSCDHSMNQTPQGERSGVTVYKQLLELHKAGKKVYIFASHSHYKLENVFDTDYWRNNGGVLPGWIIGTAGAIRYALPDVAAGMPVSRAQTNVYGYYLATIAKDGSLSVDFREVMRNEVPAEVEKTYGTKFVDKCFAENRDSTPQTSKKCVANVPCAMP